MATVRDNAIRVKRFRELKATLRTDRTRLLVGIDVAQAEHVVHLRHAHTRVVVPTFTIPNTTRGFAQLWTRIQQAQRTTGCRDVVCGLEPTGTYHQTVATFLEAQGADVVLCSSSVAYWNRRTQDGTWDKNDRKDAANCADLLEQGKVLFASQLTGPLADHPAPRPGADGGRAAAAPVGRAAGRAPGLGAARARAPGAAEGAPAARPGDRLCGSRGPSDGHTGPHRDPRSGAHPARRTASGLPPPPHDSGGRPHGGRDPPGRDR
jgi:hypothetical protein